MALTGPTYWDPSRGAVIPRGTGQRCFYCGRMIRREPTVTWAGETSQIFLHPGCAADLGIRLFADIAQWQKTEEQRFGEGPGK